MAIRSSPEQIARAYMAPPGTPMDVINILSDAFAKAIRDPELTEEARKMMMKFNYLSAEECLKAVSYILNQPEDVVKELSKYIKL